LIRRAGGGNRDGVETRTGTSRSATEKEGSEIAGRTERENERCKGSSVCNSPRWCEAMRCDRSAMSCGRPDGPAAVPCPPQLSTRLCLYRIQLLPPALIPRNLRNIRAAERALNLRGRMKPEQGSTERCYYGHLIRSLSSDESRQSRRLSMRSELRSGIHRSMVIEYRKSRVRNKVSRRERSGSSKSDNVISR